MTSLSECFTMCHEVSKEVGGALCIALYNKTQGFNVDYIRTNLEQAGADTPVVAKMRQFMAAVSEKLYKINQNAIWLHIPHSENGVITKRAIEGMTEAQQKRIQKMLYIFAVAPASPISDESAFRAINIYSEKDYITKGFAKPFMEDPNYDIQILPCISKRKDRNLFIADHMFLAPTYRKAWKDKIDSLRDKFGFYTGEKNAQIR